MENELDELFHWETILTNVKDPYKACRLLCTEEEYKTLIKKGEGNNDRWFETSVLLPFLKQKQLDDNSERFTVVQNALLGSVDAQYAMAKLSMDENKKEEAVEWWSMAAEKNHIKSQLALADYFESNADRDKALKWYRRAADQNDPVGLYNVAQLLWKQRFVRDLTPEEETEYLQCAERGAALGNLDCLYLISFWKHRHGLYKESFELRYRLAHEPNPKVYWLYALAHMYKYGIGTDKNDEASKEWRKKAHEIDDEKEE